MTFTAEYLTSVTHTVQIKLVIYNKLYLSVVYLQQALTIHLVFEKYYHLIMYILNRIRIEP